MKGRGVPMRAPENFHALIKKWKQEANNAGYNYSMIDIQRTLANNMEGMAFRPDIQLFKEPDLYDLINPMKRRRGGRR